MNWLIPSIIDPEYLGLYLPPLAYGYIYLSDASPFVGPEYYLLLASVTFFGALVFHQILKSIFGSGPSENPKKTITLIYSLLALVNSSNPEIEYTSLVEWEKYRLRKVRELADNDNVSSRFILDWLDRSSAIVLPILTFYDRDINYIRSVIIGSLVVSQWVLSWSSVFLMTYILLVGEGLDFTGLLLLTAIAVFTIGAWVSNFFPNVITEDQMEGIWTPEFARYTDTEQKENQTPLSRYHEE